MGNSGGGKREWGGHICRQVQIQGKIHTLIYTRFGIIYTGEVRPELKAALKSSKKKSLQPWKQSFDRHGALGGREAFMDKLSLSIYNLISY